MAWLRFFLEQFLELGSLTAFALGGWEMKKTDHYRIQMFYVPRITLLRCP
jgi:hypothetical protein